MKGSKVMSIWNCLFLVNNFPKMATINNGFNDCFRVLIFCVNSRCLYFCFFSKIIGYSVRKMKLNMFEVIFAICFTVQNVSEPLLILTERSIMAHIAIILSISIHYIVSYNALLSLQSKAPTIIVWICEVWQLAGQI